MPLLEQHAGLYTDYYELTMAQGYFLTGRKDTPACFDYFFRRAPFQGAYVIFAGLRDLLKIINNLKFEEEDCRYLTSLGFESNFVQYLKHFKFRGSIQAPEEGEVIFPYEPIVRVTGTLIETQLIETMVVNILSFESLIATKANRIRQSAKDKIVIDFGLRRAQGLGGIHGSKAAIIGGVDSTSNVYSAHEFGLQATGTQAHSWIQSYEEEITAFRDFSSIFPKKCILLVDTYDTLHHGIPNAILVAKEMEQKGERLLGIRLDSGDLDYLSKKARKMLDHSGLNYVKIVASNQLDEYVIDQLLKHNAPIDAFGIGTHLITGKNDAAIDGVYKLSMSDNKPRLKISEEIGKVILPGVKKVIRIMDKNEMFCTDVILMDEEKEITTIYPIHKQNLPIDLKIHKTESLLKTVMNNGQIVLKDRTVEEISLYRKERFKKLPEEYTCLKAMNNYPVRISEKLFMLRKEMITKIKKKYGSIANS